MARKDLLKDLLAQPAATPAPQARPTKGAIGAVSRSIADLKARALIEIDPGLIDPGGLSDRLETVAEEDAELARSIAEYGQQVPILVRPHPEAEGRYQVVYGRRRVLAMRGLGLPVKALVRELDDRDLVLAQGQENTARRDLSFIEKARFARQLTEAGYDRRIVCDALSLDKTALSRMLNVAERMPEEIMAAVGSAPAAGRERWSKVADLIAEVGHDTPTLVAMLEMNAQGATSDARFEALAGYLTGIIRKRTKKSPSDRPEVLRARDGTKLGEAKRSGASVVLRLSRKSAQGFEDWLVDQLPEIHRDWLSRRGE